MKKFNPKIIPIVIIVLLIILLGFYKSTIRNPVKSKEDIVITVEEGESFYRILNKLKEEGQIKGLPFIKLYVKFLNEDIEVRPGEYIIKNNSTLDELIKDLATGINMDLISVTIPEGFSIDEIANTLEKEGVCSKKDFIEALKNYKLPSYVAKRESKRYDLEGYLFPDTYLIKKGENPKDIIKVMIKRFEEALKEVEKETGVSIEKEDIEDVIIKASMIEKEAVLDKERSIIASVIENRLNINMRLQIDATVIYALGEHVDKVLYTQLELDSPYNTYQNDGLPIGPISNPGMASIKATLKPKDTDYLFYVLQDDKSHYFTDNYDDFLNKQEKLGY
ncbi:endolytic transglycosylase MltG [Clostridium sp.]|uniref:endolytic transglycosylase MltG n=1 Tax=Clostridium sp. TaxID=1506 RepID=UPI00262A0781|nr:endolytic transglycosylase MltG [Clostridium sp.]